MSTRRCGCGRGHLRGAVVSVSSVRPVAHSRASSASLGMASVVVSASSVSEQREDLLTVIREELRALQQLFGPSLPASASSTALPIPSVGVSGPPLPISFLLGFNGI